MVKNYISGVKNMTGIYESIEESKMIYFGGEEMTVREDLRNSVLARILRMIELTREN